MKAISIIILCIAAALAIPASAGEWKGLCGQPAIDVQADMTHYGIWRTCLFTTRKAANKNELARDCALACLPQIGETDPAVPDKPHESLVPPPPAGIAAGN